MVRRVLYSSRPANRRDGHDKTAEVAKQWHLASSFRDFPGLDPLDWGAPQDVQLVHEFVSQVKCGAYQSVGFFVSVLLRAGEI
jgi:hypothetical protein